MKKRARKIKPKNLKTIIVKILKRSYKIVINNDIFDDVYIEAATQAIEQYRTKNNCQISAIMECYEEKDVKCPEKHYIYNSYYVLVNAAMYDKAEHLRESFKQEFKVDLKKESVRGE